MAALAEALVDEWLNRKGFFTVRGIKDGVGEIDLLGVRPLAADIEGWHVEVQAGFRPVGYISKLTKELSRSLEKARTSAWARKPELLEQCVNGWTKTKFTDRNKVLARERAWPGVHWQFVFVHGVVREPAELQMIARHGITLVPLHRVLAELCDKTEGGSCGAAGTDLAELIEYYKAYVDSSELTP